MTLSQIELVWIRVRVEWDCFWVNLREDNKVSESKMAVSESKMAEFKMAAIIKLSRNEWLKFFFLQNGWIQDGRIQDGCQHQVVWEWIGEVLFVQNGWIQHGRIHDGCHHQVKWEWMSLRMIELVWVRVRVDWECFWVTLREDNKVSEFKMAVAESKMTEFKMASIIKWSQNEWVKFFCANIGEGIVSEVFFVQMVGTNVGNCEWGWEKKLWWPIPRWHISGWLPSSHWVKFK